MQCGWVIMVVVVFVVGKTVKIEKTLFGYYIDGSVILITMMKIVVAIKKILNIEMMMYFGYSHG